MPFLKGEILADNLARLFSGRPSRMEAAREERAAALQQLLALTAFRGANPTAEELPAFTPGKPIDSLRAVTGASPTDDPTGAQADLGAQLRNEELNRAVTQNAPMVERIQRSLAIKRAGLDENNLALGRLHDAQAADAETRGNVMREFIDDPNAHPLLKIDAAHKKDVFNPQRIKVRRADGSEVYMNETPTLSGIPQYTPAVDEANAPLRLPRLDTERPERLTSEQRDIANRARIMEFGTAAEKAALQGKDTRKRKSVEERWSGEVEATKAWGDAVKLTMKNNFLFDDLSPDQKYEAILANYQLLSELPVPVQRPGSAPVAAPPQPAPAPAKSPEAAPALPPAAARALKEGVNTRFGNGQVWTLRNGRPTKIQ